MARLPFRFDLDPVLALRERAVEAARDALVRTVRRRADAEAALARAQADHADHLAAPGATAQTAAQLSGSAAHRHGLSQAVEEARRGVALAATDERRARHALTDALRQREALTLLRTEAVQTHRADALRAEIVAMDDLAAGARPSLLSR